MRRGKEGDMKRDLGEMWGCSDCGGVAELPNYRRNQTLLWFDPVLEKKPAVCFERGLCFDLCFSQYFPLKMVPVSCDTRLIRGFPFNSNYSNSLRKMIYFIIVIFSLSGIEQLIKKITNTPIYARNYISETLSRMTASSLFFHLRRTSSLIYDAFSVFLSPNTEGPCNILSAIAFQYVYMRHI